MNPKVSILYSFRRCPYAIRARLALKLAEIPFEHREVELKHKPQALLAVSGKGTVPVLILEDQEVIDESLDIMRWAFTRRDPDDYLSGASKSLQDILIAMNDGDFKNQLDHYKYADRHPLSPADYRDQAQGFLELLESNLQMQAYLLGAQPCLADLAIFPFIRQFSMVDQAWFAQAPYPRLRLWLQHWLESEVFLSVMTKHKPWKEGEDATYSP